jgi:hypothetical protein
MPNRLIHGHTNPRTPEYRAWGNMCDRCLNERHPNYADYGGRGITVCERWFKFENFLADMGPRADTKSLGRINCNGNYEPNNCRWESWPEQGRSRRSNKLTLAAAREIRMLSGRGYSNSELAREFGVNASSISKIIAGKQWKE